MKKHIYILSLFFFALSLFAQDSTIKFYISGGNSPKEFKISDINNMELIKSEIPSIFRVFYMIDSLTRYYDLSNINQILFENQQIKFMLNDTTISININEIDSITIKQNQLPLISSITPNTTKISDTITISGINFGYDRDTSYISFAGALATEYTNWSDTEIKVKVPTGAKSGKLWLVVCGEKSNEVDFIVKSNDTGDYETVTFCSQVWMKKNLNVHTYRNGDSIPEVTDPTQWENLTTGAWCYYNNDPANGEIYGKLYNWYAVNDPRGLAPEGWRVPTDAEWTELKNCLITNGYNYDGTTTGNKIAKSLATASGWVSSTIVGSVGNTDYPSKRNSTVFSALPGGYRGAFGYEAMGECGRWWSTTVGISAEAWDRYLYYNSTSFVGLVSYNEYGLSVRCVRD